MREYQFLEGMLKITGPLCEIICRNEEGTATRIALMPEAMIEINPAPHVWITGIYNYDEEYNGHTWTLINSEIYFVGLVSGMNARVSF